MFSNGAAAVLPAAELHIPSTIHFRICDIERIEWIDPIKPYELSTLALRARLRAHTLHASSLTLVVVRLEPQPAHHTLEAPFSPTRSYGALN